MRPPVLRLATSDLVVDNFAGGGGASTGIEWALGRSPDIAVNHDPEAVALHAANHPDTKHFCESVWTVDPKVVCGGRRVRVAWFSPDCKHFSKAKGGKPVDKKIRSLAWVVIRWARAVKPDLIFLENVAEFQDWGPLGRVYAPARARAPRPTDETSPAYRLLEVKASPPWGFEAVVLRPDGKTSGYFGPTALAARERAEREIAAGGAR